MLRLVILSLLLCFSTFVYADSEFINRPDVQEFIQQMVVKHGFNKKQLIALFDNIKLRKQVIRNINKPLEQETWYKYQLLFVTESRIKEGVKFWNKYAPVLQKAEEVYGIPPGIIVATLGVETKYGQKMGEYRVLDSLANLAFNSSRSKFFRKELTEFLLLTREQHVNPFSILGSYAGAIGQPQFMPSSYRYYAVNFSKSGTIDLMHNEIDVIGSVANYYKKMGWKPNTPVATPAYMMGNHYDYLMRNFKGKPLTLTELSRLGIIPKNKINPDDLRAKVIELQNHFSKEYWLGFHNFDVIKRYNSSNLYAMAVLQLSYYITAQRERHTNESI